MIRAISITFLVLSLISFYMSFAGAEKASEEALQNDENSQSETTEDTREPGDVVVIEINGSINPGTLDYIRSGLDEAKSISAEALVIQLDTPGGLLTSTKEIVKLLLNSPVPIIVYVSPSGATATSAGVFITLAANVAAMAPGTSIGAAAPVSLTPGGSPPQEPEEEQKDDSKDEKEGEKVADKDEDGKDGEDKESEPGSKSQQEIMGEKIENFAASFIQSIAEHRDRNVEWAIQAVRESDAITAPEALELNVIDLISPNLNDLLDEVDGMEVNLPEGERTLMTKGAEIIKLAMSAKQRLIDILSTPDIAFMLLSLGSLGLLLEFYNPGLIFPGVAGVVCLLLGFVSFQILPFNYAGIVLLLLAIGLFVTEVYVTSFGLLSLGGVISFGLGALLLFDTPDSDLRVGFDVVIATTLAFGLFFFYVAYYMFKAARRTPQLGYEGLMGEQGEAVSDIDQNQGKVYLVGEYWDAVSDSPIGEGEKIEVIDQEKGFKLKVKKLEVDS